MKPTAPLESVDPGDILDAVFATRSGGPEELVPQIFTVDLSRFAGQTVRLRFAMATDSDKLHAILDGVSIASSPIIAPPAITPVPAAPQPPSNTFSTGRLVLNRKNGSAVLAVNVPDAGTLIATDARRKVAVASRRGKKAKPIYVKTATVGSGAAGTVQVPIRPTAAALKVLRRKGTLQVRLSMTFTPIGGSAATQSYSAKLARRLSPAPR